MAGVYIVAAWIVIEVASILFPAWGIPDSALRYLVFAAVLCFPIAVAFGWIYDVTSDGIVRTADADPIETDDLSLKRADYIVLALLFATGTLVVLGSAKKVVDEIELLAISEQLNAKVENSIAVLPFVNLDSNPDTGYFSDGVTEEILHRLSAMKELHILGRTSSFAFRNSDDGPARISEILGVQYLLHGSVRRDGSFVRVTSRLTDDTGYQVWSQTFDRKLEGIFAIQSEIASAVTTQVMNKIMSMDLLPGGRTTTSMDAYDAYLVGKAFTNSRTPGWQNKASAAFQKAIDLDPNYAPPHAGLAVALTVGQGKNYESRPAALAAATRSIELDPELAEGHAAMGLVMIVGKEADPPTAIIVLRRALKINPSLPIAYNWLATALKMQGLGTESDAVQDQGLAIDPLNPSLSVNIGNRYLRLGQHDRAERLMLRLTQLPEPPGLAYWGLMNLYFDTGRYDEGVRWAKEAVRGYLDSGNIMPLAALAWSYQRLDLMDDADYWITVFSGQVRNPIQRFISRSYLWKLRGDSKTIGVEIEQLTATPGVETSNLHGFPAAVLAAALIQNGKYAAGIELFESAFNVKTLSILEDLGSMAAYEFAHTLAYGYRQVGRNDEAAYLLHSLHEKLLELTDDEKFIYGPVYEVLALNRGISGDLTGSHEALKAAIEIGWKNTVWINNDPVWSEIIADPDIAKLLKGIPEELGRQRAIVIAADNEHDFRAEITARMLGARDGT